MSDAKNKKKTETKSNFLNIFTRGKSANKEEQLFSRSNPFVMIVILVMIIALLIGGFMGGGVVYGLIQSFKDLSKTKIKNSDGTYSIPDDAPVDQNRDNPNTYVARVLNQKIQLGRNDNFNQQLYRIMNAKELNNPYEKYQYVKYFYEQEINKIIAMHNAEKLNIVITKDYLIDEVGKRYYADQEGDVDKFRMAKESEKVNSFIGDIVKDLMYKNFVEDYFHGLPLSNEELWDEYKIDNTTIGVKYIDLSNSTVDNNSLEKYFNLNREKYKQYKLVRLVFEKKEDAEKSLEDLKKDSSKFSEKGTKLKQDGKIINIIYDSDYIYAADLDNYDLIETVKSTKQGEVGNKVVQTNVGFIVFKLEKEKYADFKETQSKVKSDYLAENYTKIKANNDKIALDLFNTAKNIGIDQAAARYNLTVQKSQPASFMSNNIPNLNPDTTDDLNFMLKIFKANIGDVLGPYSYANGYLIIKIQEKNEASRTKFENMFEDMAERYTNEKIRTLQEDYYKNEKKKIEVIDNFKYVFNYQMFMPQEERSQGGGVSGPVTGEQ